MSNLQTSASSYMSLGAGPVSVSVEYTANGVRVTKKFESPYKARTFYAQKLRAGANPQVKK